MSWISRLKNAFNSRKLDDEIAEELQTHVEALAASLKVQGLSEAAALRQARLRFGNATQLQERTRDFKIAGFADSVFQDVRYTLRGARKAPGFYVTAALSLALAIGAVTAIYSILAAAVLRPLPVRDAGKLVTLGTDSPFHLEGDGHEGQPFNYPLYRNLQNAAGGDADLQLFSQARSTELQGLTARANSMVMQQYISGGALPMLGITPLLGRLLRPSDDVLPNGNDVAVISFQFWSRQFNRDPNVLGKKLRVNGHAYEIAGVTRAEFFGVEPGKFVDLSVPAATYEPKRAFTSHHFYWFYILGRISGPGAKQLAAKLQPTFRSEQVEQLRDARDVPEQIRKNIAAERLWVRTADLGVSQFRNQFRRPVWIVFTVSVVLMLIACANIASLLLARGTARNAEMAMRISLGASRTRLLRQMLTESVLLSLASGAFGWLLARLLAPLLVSLLSTQRDPIQFALQLDTKALLFCSLASLLAAVVFGAAPAFQSSRVSPISSLRSSSGQAGRLVLGRWIVSTQVAGAFCLVVTGAAFSFTLWHLLARDKGFDAGNVTVLEVGEESMGGKSANHDEQRRQLMGRLKASAGIEMVGGATWPIYQHTAWSERVTVPGGAKIDREELYYPVTPGYFQAMRTRLLSGRDFNDRDSQTQQPIAAIVNAALAQRYFGTVNATGKAFQRNDKGKVVNQVVIGVVQNAFYNGTREGAEPMVYVPMTGGTEGSLTLYIRSPLPVSAVLRIAQDQAEAVGTHVRIATSLDTLVGNSVLREKLLAGLGFTFGVLSLLLAGIGVFGLLNYSVVRRTRELGIRAALGATRPNLVGLVVRDLAAMMSIGFVAGLIVSLSLMPLLRTLFFGIETYDPSVMVTAACCFVVAAFIAGGLPARRAACVDPNVALREE